MLKKAKIKDLETTDLLNKIIGADDEDWEEIFEELTGRVPFDYLNEQIDELMTLLEEQGKETQKLRNSMRGHTHLPNGKSVIEI